MSINNLGKESVSNFGEKAKKDSQHLENDLKKENALAMRQFYFNVRKIKLDTPYTIAQIEFFFNMRFEEELIDKLRDNFAIKESFDGRIIFSQRE